MSEDYKFPTESVDLPSNGLVYSKDNPLSSGKIEMKYMTAKEEDILTNQNYIKDGSVLDRLLKALIVSKEVNYDDLIVGDKNAIMIAARILGYGADYSFKYENEDITVDLQELTTIPLDESQLVEKNVNKFEYTLPHSNTPITFKLLSNRDDKAVKAEVKGLRKIDKKSAPELSTRLKHMLLSINGDTDKSTIRKFVDNYMLARDSRSFREYIKTFQPDIDLKFNYESNDGIEREVSLPMTVSFFWPDSDL
jgi:hypothetical protein|tara:strand:- start:2697 stop:3449 length:753 start_codon:yes stop_codon:yes gene_type:complete